MNFGPCMCGDTQCPSCGPAQGYNPELELVTDYLEFLSDKHENVEPAYDCVDSIRYVLELLGQEKELDFVRDELTRAAQTWRRETRRN